MVDNGEGGGARVLSQIAFAPEQKFPDLLKVRCVFMLDWFYRLRYEHESNTKLSQIENQIRKRLWELCIQKNVLCKRFT